MVEVIRFRCPNCGALYDKKSAVELLLAKNFLPLKVEEVEEEKPKPLPQPKPQPKVVREPEPVEEDEEDLTLD